MANVQKAQLNGGQSMNGFHHSSSSSSNCTKDTASGGAPLVDEETLSRLESLMNEFFYPSTSNERKRQIESILSEFSALPNSWQASFLYFEMSTNEYTKMFCLTVIETFINQRWHTVPSDLRATFRSRLWAHLIECTRSQHAQLTSPIRNKYCKIIVSIARFDWPYSYADYLTNVLELLTPETVHNIAHSASLILLSLNLLGMTVEELTSPSCNYHFSSNRQVELLKLIESNLPAMLHALTSLLEMIISKQINFISATPPPSPTSSPPNALISNLNKASDTFNSAFQMSIKKGLFESIPDMDADFVQMTAQVFACLSRIIAFMPATYYSNLNQTLLSAMYVFANFGAFNPSYNSAKLGLAAMACINELMSKASAFNSDANEFIYNVFHNTFLILQRLTNGSLLSKAPEEGSLDDRPDEDYLKKFIDFLKLFITGHLGRFEKFISFPTKDFLALLLQFTTKMHHSLECYLMLLDVWSIYLDYLESCLTVKHKDKSAMAEKLQAIKEPIFGCLHFVVSSIQYSCNREYLQQLDDITVDDDGRTEFEQYVQTSIEIVAKIGEIYPEEAIAYVDGYFNEKLQSIHYGLEFFINNKSAAANGYRRNSTGKLFTAEAAQQPIGQLQLGIHDFITTLQVCSRFSHFFVAEYFEHYFSRTKLIFDKLFEILQFLEAHHCCDVYQLNVLSAEFFLLKAQLLATFKAYIVWFQQLCCHVPADKSQAVAGGAGAADALLTTIFNTCCFIICDTSLVDGRHGVAAVLLAKRKLFHSAALTLSTFSANVRPSMVFGLSPVQRLFDQNVLANVLQLCDINSNINEAASGGGGGGGHRENVQHQSLGVTDQILISQSISNLLVLPWFSLQNDSQEWDRRLVCLNLFVGNFLQLFNKLNFDNVELSTSALASSAKGGGGRNGESESGKVPNIFCRSLYILRKVIKAHADSPVKSKQMLFASLDSSLEAFTQLLVHNAFLHTTVVGCQITEHILALFLVVFDVLLAQMHIDFVKRTIQTLLQIIHTHEVLSPAANGSAPAHGSLKEASALKVITKFLKLLGLIIKQTSFNAALRSLLPGIIDFTVAHIQTNLISVKCTASVYFSGVNGQHYDTYGKLLKVYYRFLYELMLNNCRYFFPLSNVNKISFGPAGANEGAAPAEAANSHQRHFESIMEIVGQSFMQPENIQLYRQNVEALESLNETIKLYSRAAFKSTFLERFLYLFVQTLLDRSLDLLEELLYTIVYHLVEVDFAHFYESFIPKFLSNIQHLTDMQRTELVSNLNIGRVRSGTHEAQIDFPTFNANLNRLLCDIRFYHKCNSA